MARVNITRQVKTELGWKNISLDRDGRGRIKWGRGSGIGRYIIEWYEDRRRRRESAGITPSDALEAQRRKHLELEALKSHLKILPADDEGSFLLTTSIKAFLKDIRAFRKPLTYQKYEYILELLADYVAPKRDARHITTDDVKGFLA